MPNLKFRAWDLKQLCFWKVQRLLFDTDLNIIAINMLNWKQYTSSTILIDQLILEQYTGKKDIEGKEIFVNDIFKDSYHGCTIYLKVVYNEEACMFGVNYYDGELREESFVEFLTMEDYNFSQMKIIGNTHEKTT